MADWKYPLAVMGDKFCWISTYFTSLCSGRIYIVALRIMHLQWSCFAHRIHVHVAWDQGKKLASEASRDVVLGEQRWHGDMPLMLWIHRPAINLSLKCQHVKFSSRTSAWAYYAAFVKICTQNAFFAYIHWFLGFITLLGRAWLQYSTFWTLVYKSIVL